MNQDTPEIVERYAGYAAEHSPYTAALLRRYAAILRERESAKEAVSDDDVCDAMTVMFGNHWKPHTDEYSRMRAVLEAFAPMLASARVPDAWNPTDAEVMTWMERNDIDDRSVSDMRTAIDDARSMHMLAAAPKRVEG